jgi:tetratricopeptide (TPR) repeat protein
VRDDAELGAEHTVADPVRGVGQPKEAGIGSERRAVGQRAVDRIDRGRREREREGGLHEARVKVVPQRGEHRPTLGLGHVRESRGEGLRGARRDIREEEVKGRDRAHVSPEKRLDAPLQSDRVERGAVEGHQDHALRAEIRQRLTGADDELGERPERDGPASGARGGIDARVERARAEKRPRLLTGAGLFDRRVEASREAGRDEVIVAEREVWAVVLDRIDREKDGSTAAEQGAGLTVGEIEDRDGVSHVDPRCSGPAGPVHTGRMRRDRLWLRSFAGMIAAFAFSTAGGGASAQARGREARGAGEQRAVERALARAEQALARRQRDRALALLEASTRRSPHDGRAALRVCELLVPDTDGTVASVLAGERAGAARCLAALTLVTLAPGDEIEARFSAALVWARALTGDRGPALSRLASRPLDERDTPALTRLAALAIGADALDDADTALSLARRVRPNDLSLAADLGAVRLAMGDAASAATLFRAVVAGHPGDRDALHDLAGAYLQSGEHAAAVRLLEQLARDEPDVGGRWLDLARARTELGAYAEAAEDARRAVDLGTADDTQACLALGDALRLGGDTEGARRAYEEAVRRDSRSLRARRALESIDAR